MERINDLITRMADIREDLDLTQMEMSERLGIKQGVYSRWEKGKEIISLRRLNQFANLTDCSLDYICGFTRIRNYSQKLDALDQVEVGKRLRAFRKENNITQKALSDYLNTTQSTISAYEKGRALLLTAFAIQIARKYKLSIDWICGKSDEKNITKA